jgi:hypothetical protein
VSRWEALVRENCSPDATHAEGGRAALNLQVL